MVTLSHRMVDLLHVAPDIVRFETLCASGQIITLQVKMSLLYLLS